MRCLNIGAGYDDEGDVKLDIVTITSPDVRATASQLPFIDASFDLVIMDQVLEHIPPDDLQSVLEEVYRILTPGGVLRASVPHAGTRLSDQDPTHRTTWTYKTPEYFADGNFAWYYEDAEFDFDLVKQDVIVWSHPEVRFNRIRSKLLQNVQRLFGREDSLLYWPTVAGSVKFELKKNT